MADKFFIDVSEFNSVDWSRVNVSHAYIRIGIRGSLKKTAPADYKLIRFDKKWKENLAGVQKYKIPYGPYFFPTAITKAEAVEEAKWLYMQVKDLDMTLPPILDSENVWGTGREPGRANGLSKEDRTKFLKVITDYLNERGINCGIYASASWLKNKIDMNAFPQCVINCTWVADSTGPVDYSGYYWLHQYGKGYINGASGTIDLNRVTGKIPPARISEKPVEEKNENPADVVIQIAESQVGYHEGANNHTKYGDELHAIQPKNMDKNAAWCDAFVDWCILQMCKRFGYGAEMARKVLCGDFDDYTYASVALYKKAGRWTQKPARGCQIFFGGSGHTGIVTDVKGSTVYTIEGNKADAVRRCSYSVGNGNIIGYGRPKYELITGSVVVSEEEYDMPLIKKGSNGKAVKVLQVILGNLTVDGDFGWKTLNATINFQKAHGLDPDGEVGPRTWKALLDTL